ncbi:MAG: hypothetical protein KA314_14170 [Chloroflexi bacterium]|nr:hypothetical protein [Chloroflexota bacterium]MBP8056980.1 hypothetical protein [Chloroflexota bacterium]
MFPFTDFRGKKGNAGQTYHAWQLPNTYFGPHAHLGAAADATIIANWQTCDTKGTRNGRVGDLVQRYFGNGASAGKGWMKCGRGVAYWPGKKGRRVVVWWVMEEVGVNAAATPFRLHDNAS